MGSVLRIQDAEAALEIEAYFRRIQVQFQNLLNLAQTVDQSASMDVELLGYVGEISFVLQICLQCVVVFSSLLFIGIDERQKLFAAEGVFRDMISDLQDAVVGSDLVESEQVGEFLRCLSVFHRHRGLFVQGRQTEEVP